MNKEDYDKLVAIKEKAIVDIKSILGNDAHISLNVGVHFLDRNDEIWDSHFDRNMEVGQDNCKASKLNSPINLFSVFQNE